VIRCLSCECERARLQPEKRGSTAVSFDQSSSITLPEATGSSKVRARQMF
jgi:hypothetical protein